MNAEVPVKNAKELAEYAKAKSASSSSRRPTGTPPHILAFVFKELTGADFPVALYRGGGPAMADLFANQVQAIFQPTTIVMPLLDDKRVQDSRHRGRAALEPAARRADAGRAGLPAADRQFLERALPRRPARPRRSSAA